MGYDSSHNHGSVKNGCISNRIVTFQMVKVGDLKIFLGLLVMTGNPTILLVWDGDIRSVCGFCWVMSEWEKLDADPMEYENLWMKHFGYPSLFWGFYLKKSLYLQLTYMFTWLDHWKRTWETNIITILYVVWSARFSGWCLFRNIIPPVFDSKDGFFQARSSPSSHDRTLKWFRLMAENHGGVTIDGHKFKQYRYLKIILYAV